MLRRKLLDLPKHLLKCLIVGGLFLSLPAGAINVVVKLKNGDQLTGQLVAQETNQVIIATTWADSLVLPLSIIGGLRTTDGTVLYAPPPPPAPPPAPPAASPVAQAKTKPVPPAPRTSLTTKANLGLDLLFGAKERQIYYTRIKSTYEHPYDRNPKQYFRTIADYTANYGETDGDVSANNMAASVQTDFDFGPVYYFYNAANVGYDQIRKIDLQYGVGPGIGRHLYARPAFVLNVDGGVNYQVQKRSEGESPESAYLRLGDNLTWKLADRITLSKKFDFLLSCENASQFRFRLDSNLEYRLWNNLSFNLSFLDLYDTNPAPGVDQNEVQLRSSLGFTF
jgi:hypothetical protein